MLYEVKIKSMEDLIKYDLNIEIFDNFEFEIKDIIPVRKVFILDTNKGYKILKKLNISEKDMDFITQGLCYIRRRGFENVLRINKTKKNQFYFSWDGEYYCVMDLVKGRESQYDNPIDIEICSEYISKLHAASEGFKYIDDYRNKSGRAIKSLSQEIEELKLFKELASIQPQKEFDKIFLKNYDRIAKQALKSIKILEKANYYKVCSKEDTTVLCHHDLANHNILIEGERAYFIDFDYSIIDLRVHDLCNFILKVEKNCKYEIEQFDSIIKTYEKYKKLSDEERKILLAYMYFPKDLYHLAKNYYTRKKQWYYETFVNRIKDKIELNYLKSEFLDKVEKNFIKTNEILD